jgi:iron complex outermembrane receptor protein
VHYQPTAHSQVTYQYRFAQLDNIYQRANRFRLEDYVLQQHALTFQSEAWKAQVYLNTENTGRSYNLRSMAENMDRSFKSDEVWFSHYQSAFQQAAAGGAPVADAHRLARLAADSGRPVPGTDDFRDRLEQLRSINNWDVGAALHVRARMVHTEAQWNATADWLRPLRERWGLEVLAGFDHRTYVIVPDGNYFINPEQQKGNLTYSRTGSFVQATLPVWTNVRVNATLRADKNEYFPVKLNPRVTAVYNFNPTARVRLAVQNGFRFPSVFEAFSNVNSGGVKRVGGLPVMSRGIFESSYNRASIDAFQAAILREVNAGAPREEAIRNNAGLIQSNDYTYLVPEQIRSLEVGYQDAYFNDRLRLDIDFYLNRYQDLIAQVEVNIPRTTQSDSVAFYLADRTRQDRYRMWTNSKTKALNIGSSAHVAFRLPRQLELRAQVAFARLQRTSRNDGLEDGFNTPAWVVSGTVAHRTLLKHVGFELTHRWQSAYTWQSFLVNGRVPSFQTLDAQVTRTGKKTTCKVGATNALNRHYYSFLGGPSVGGFYYVTWVVNSR